MAAYFYKIMGEEHGPIEAADLRRLARRGKIPRDALIRASDTERWVLADTVHNLFPDAGVTCPQCRRRLEAGTDLCVDCGYDFRSGKRTTRGELPEDDGEPEPANLREFRRDARHSLREVLAGQHDSSRECYLFLGVLTLLGFLGPWLWSTTHPNGTLQGGSVWAAVATSVLAGWAWLLVTTWTSLLVVASVYRKTLERLPGPSTAFGLASFVARVKLAGLLVVAVCMGVAVLLELDETLLVRLLGVLTVAWLAAGTWLSARILAEESALPRSAGVAGAAGMLIVDITLLLVPAWLVVAQTSA